MKLGQKIGLNDILDEFENGYVCFKNMAAKWRGIFPYMAIVKSCEHSRGHIYCLIFIKLGQKIYFNNILEDFENDAGWLKNMAARGRGIFLIWL